MGEEPAAAMTIGQLGHRPGLHVSVDVKGKTIGGELFEAEQWVPAVVVGLGGDGTFLTVKLDTALGGGERHGLLRRESGGQELLSFDDPSRVRVLELGEAQPDGVPEEIVELAHEGKTLKAIKRYRELNGATLDEARAAIAKL